MAGAGAGSGAAQATGLTVGAATVREPGGRGAEVRGRSEVTTLRETLERWAERVLEAATLEEVFEGR